MQKIIAECYCGDWRCKCLVLQIVFSTESRKKRA